MVLERLLADATSYHLDKYESRSTFSFLKTLFFKDVSREYLAALGMLLAYPNESRKVAWKLAVPSLETGVETALHAGLELKEIPEEVYLPALRVIAFAYGRQLAEDGFIKPRPIRPAA
jgi:hypothetical protein